MASTEPWEKIFALDPAEAIDREHRAAPQTDRHCTTGNEKRVAGRITPRSRSIHHYSEYAIADTARAQAAGDEVRTVIAGYHWFTDWGRDTMISLEGLTLTTGRHLEAGYILRTFAYYIKDGLIPNMFPEGENKGFTTRRMPLYGISMPLRNISGYR